MTVNKKFAVNGGDLDALMDQLVEVLAQLLEEPVGPQNQGHLVGMSDLHLGNDRGIHVIEKEPESGY
jgi:hypothetical protein